MFQPKQFHDSSEPNKLYPAISDGCYRSAVTAP